MEEKPAAEQRQDFIEKDLDSEAAFKDQIAYRRLAGASDISCFRSPDCYILLLFEKCSGTHTIDLIEYEQKDLQLHVSFPGQLHSWHTGPGAVGQKLIISKRLIELSPYTSLYSNVAPVLDLTPDEYDGLEYEFSEIGKIVDSPRFSEGKTDMRLVENRIQIIAIMLNGLLESDSKPGRTPRRIPPVLAQFKKLVDAQYKESRHVAVYARQLHISANYLNILCQRHFGISAKEYIVQRLLLECRRLLMGSEQRIKEIAFSLGFNDMPGFSSFVKSKTGLTPRELRDK